ncbi:MAG: DUF3644 domain-containing protein [Verrucomicrobiota bacterium]
MKARAKELLDRAIAATIAAIEIYNKPDFRYREEAFAVLAINGWELLLKAKWLADHGNDLASLYVREPSKSKAATKSSKLRIKRTRSGNPFTHSMDFLAKKLVDSGGLDANAWKNIEALLELRDSAIHFYNHSPLFAQRLQEIGAASVKNFAAAAADWFKRDLSEFNFYLMPLSFVRLHTQAEAIVLNPEEQNFIKFVESLETKQDNPDARYSVSVNIEIKFTRSKAKDALGVQVTNNPNAPEVRMTDEQIREKYPWDYDQLTDACRKRYAGFKSDQKYHDCRKKLAGDKRFCHVRELDPGNPRSAKKPFFNANIMLEFDKHYKRTTT